MSISDQIHNYYESKVIEAVNELARPRGYTEDQLIDIACLALNNLPTRYFRHEVDMVFYMSGQDIEDIIRRALVRLKQGEYTQCEACGDEIAHDRLKALPYTSVCIECTH